MKPKKASRPAFGTRSRPIARARSRAWITILFCAFSVSALANECIELPQRDAFKRAAIVFSGRVERVEPVTRREGDPAAKVQLERPLDGSPAVVTFSVTKTWKGAPDNRVKLFLFQKPLQGPGYQFQIGHEYVVYAHEATKWDPLVRIGQADPVYDLESQCPLRVRTDVVAESKRLGANKR